ncbi:2OG-Fe(II) oxygenase [Prochlorococcus sp. MIT 0916]|uniref:2OG-Fe(II) oxygenase n=1 Tax=Prochlorococcus sp. MIT 0916 TaxID=3082521 RepID=UPI0039B5A09B
MKETSLINQSHLLKTDSIKLSNEPFPHYLINNFFKKEIAEELESEFPDFNSSVWHIYKNQLEIKKTCNDWNKFPKLTYKVFSYLNSNDFIEYISKCLFKNILLYPDFGLHGGGWHIHGKGGKLNTHLDYSIHPKLKKQRKLNLIIYLNSNWQESWGGKLGFWNNQNSKEPGGLVKEIEPKFNTAIIFDTSMNSWHGLTSKIKSPENEFRKSIAIYYLTNPADNTDKRSRALFSPSEEQKNDPAILNLIKMRSDELNANKVYQTDY